MLLLLFRSLLLACLTVFLLSCDKPVARKPSLGEAYVGPMTLPLRQDLPLTSPVVTTLKHGDRLEIVTARKRFIKVRSPLGSEGWVDSRQLMATAQMNNLRELAKVGGQLPSQGLAKTFEALNMHAEPSRVSPGFYQIAEGQQVEVVAHRVAARAAGEQPAGFVLPPTPKPPSKKKKRGEKKAPLLPPPLPPELPADWRERSKSAQQPPTPAELAAEERRRELEAKLHPPPKPEDWALVRTVKEKKVGWVLNRNLSMLIPDDVAQYAEGQRISSYFSLGSVQDGEERKHHWLWTTASRPGLPAEYDGFRVFTYNARKHRYETTYREREVLGYYPTELSRVQVPLLTKRLVDTPAFALLVQGEDGRYYRKKYVFEGYRVRLLETIPAAAPRGVASPAAAGVDAGAMESRSGDAADAPGGGWRDRWAAWRRKLFRQ